jgi:hypothetical protein
MQASSASALEANDNLIKETAMSKTQKWGGYAAIVTGLVFAAILVIQFAVLAPQGEGPTATPEVSLGVATRLTSVYLVQSLFNLVFAITLVMGAMAVRERLGPGAPNRMRLAVTAASIAGALFIANGAISFTALPGVVAAHDVVAYGIVGIVLNGLLYGAIFAFGLTALLWGWAGLATRGLPTGLNYVLLLAGVAAVLAVVIPILGLLSLFINVIWAFWLGYVLLMQPAPTMSQSRPAM